MQSAGTSLFLDLYGCNPEIVDSPEKLQEIFSKDLVEAGFSLVTHLSHYFPSQGITIIIILQQSHAVLHSWPENQFISVDIYSCGDEKTVQIEMENIQSFLVRDLKVKKVCCKFVIRGIEF